MKIVIIVLLSYLKGQTTQTTNYDCYTNNNLVKFTLSQSFHSAWNSLSNCSRQQCFLSTTNKNNCQSSPTPCFDYRTLNNQRYCSPGIQCSILEECNNVTMTCASSTSVCIVNSCCSPRAVCLPMLLTDFCPLGWLDTVNMIYSRNSHTASVLTNGKVLVTGGHGTGAYLNTAELYDPSTSLWIITGNMTDARYLHTASVLTNGNVLITGGYGYSGYLANAELYDPMTGFWTVTANMTYARHAHKASVLTDGKVLVTGGYGYSSYLNSAELYDLSTGLWTTTRNMSYARSSHTVSVLNDGTVLVTGGSSNINSLNSAEIYNSSTGLWTITGNMTYARYLHTASVLTNGEVLVTGGSNGSIYIYLNSAELY